MRARFRIEELGIEAHAIGGALNASFQDIAHAKLAAELPEIDRLVLVGKSRRARDHEGIRDARNVGRQALGDAVGEVVVLVAAEIGERQHDDRKSRRAGSE